MRYHARTVRMAEHKAAVRRGDRNNGIAVHAWDEDHWIDWAGVNIKEQLWERKALEAVQSACSLTHTTWIVA